jgi:hypothetical protein
LNRKDTVTGDASSADPKIGKAQVVFEERHAAEEQRERGKYQAEDYNDAFEEVVLWLIGMKGAQEYRESRLLNINRVLE